MSIQALVEAVQWAKENPKLHNQNRASSCLMGRAKQIMEYSYTESHLYFHEALGITYVEYAVVFSEFDNAVAIELAEEIIASYSLASV